MTHHGAALHRLTKDPDFVHQIKTDYRKTGLSDGDRRMLDFVVNVTREPWKIVRDDVQTLIDAGFSETAVLDIVQISGYFAFVNRLADGLGVQLEDYWEDVP